MRWPWEKPPKPLVGETLEEARKREARERRDRALEARVKLLEARIGALQEIILEDEGRDGLRAD